MTTDALLELAAARGYGVEYTHLPVCLSMALSGASDKGYIGMDVGLHGTSEKEHLAHEVGHCGYGGFYNRHSRFDIREKAERRANKWAYSRLLPVGEVRDAMKHGMLEAWELAEMFEVSVQYAVKALEYYKSIRLI